jgi:hypothetical protein
MSLTSTNPGPQTWTIRLKHHKTTVLVHVDPLQTLLQLKTELLAILNESFPTGLHGYNLPTSPNDIRLAKLIDPLDMSRGWDTIDDTSTTDELEDPFNIDEDDVPKPKTKKMLESENLKAYGIKDNAVLAFRFKSEKGREWDVVQAVNIDEYGVENEADMGVAREYKG